VFKVSDWTSSVAEQPTPKGRSSKSGPLLRISREQGRQDEKNLSAIEKKEKKDPRFFCPQGNRGRKKSSKKQAEKRQEASYGLINDEAVSSVITAPAINPEKSPIIPEVI